MTATRTSTLAIALLALGGCAIVLGMLTAQPALFITAVPLLAALWLGQRPNVLPVVSVGLEVSPARAIEGGRVALRVTLESDAPVPFVDMLVPMPANLACARGSARWVTSLVRGGEFQQRIELLATMAGRARIGTVIIRLSDAMGLWDHDIEVDADTEVFVYPQVMALQHVPLPDHTRTTFGNHVSTRVGEGIEPDEVRPFVPGDRVRHINWPASLRRQQLYVTQFDAERTADVVLLVDTFAVAGARPRSTVDACSRAAAALAMACITRRDRVGMIEVGGYLRWLRPKSGRAQLDRLLGAMLPGDVVFTYVTHRLDYIPRAALPPQALVLAVTPLIDARFEKAALDLIHRGYQVAMLAVRPLGFMRDTLPESHLNETALRLWSLERAARIRALRAHGMTVVEWDPDLPLASSLAVHGWPPRARGRS